MFAGARTNVQDRSPAESECRRFQARELPLFAEEVPRREGRDMPVVPPDGQLGPALSPAERAERIAERLHRFRVHRDQSTDRIIIEVATIPADSGDSMNMGKDMTRQREKQRMGATGHIG